MPYGRQARKQVRTSAPSVPRLPRRLISAMSIWFLPSPSCLPLLPGRNGLPRLSKSEPGLLFEPLCRRPHTGLGGYWGTLFSRNKGENTILVCPCNKLTPTEHESDLTEEELAFSQFFMSIKENNTTRTAASQATLLPSVVHSAGIRALQVLGETWAPERSAPWIYSESSLCHCQKDILLKAFFFHNLEKLLF